MTLRGICAEIFCLVLPKSFNTFIYSHMYGFCLHTYIYMYFSNLKILHFYVHGGAQEKDRCGTEGYGLVGIVGMSSDGRFDLMAGSPAHDRDVETR